MFNVEEIKKIVELSNSAKLLKFFSASRKQIYDAQCKLLSNEQPTAYIKYLLQNPEGQKRIRFFIESIVVALKGDVDVFFIDQQKIGYVRAQEGHRLEDILGFTLNMKEALWIAIQKYNWQVKNSADRLDLDDMYVIHKVLDCSYFWLSLYFLKTRDEIIARNKDQLYKLQHYATKVVSIFKEEKICAYASRGVFEIYGLSGTFVVLTNRDNERPLENIKLIGLPIPDDLLNRVCNTKPSSVKALVINSNDETIPFEEWTPHEPLRFICQPIRDSDKLLRGILFIHNRGSLFDFSKFDGDLLHQFCYFTEAVLSNSIMATKLVENKEELSNLAGRLISLQEFERKEVAADIHDTLTQALTGMGYKALLCQEIMHKDLDRLDKELDELITLINTGLQESRQIISNLRPYMLDDIGTIAALKKLLNTFKTSTGVELIFSSPDKIKLDSDKGIALFRILQESLSNIKKHSGATRVRVSLDVNAKSGLYLQVHDNGKGFRSGQKKKMVSGMGLLIMRERVEALNGKFDVYSRPAEGCKISVTIPLKDRSRNVRH